MEFPGLGHHCAETTCKLLDFLPVKCDACSKIFCSNHSKYDAHQCPESYRKDNQVPVCPLCNKPIPVSPTENADMKVGQHIDTDCQSDPAKERRGKVYTNRCNAKGCKKKELVPMNCDNCRLNFCIRHRHQADHECRGFAGSGRGMSSSGVAALNRNSASTSSGGRGQQSLFQSFMRKSEPSRQSGGQSLQNGMTEDEAMARAIQMSMADQKPAKPLSRQEQEDLDLAKALQESEREARRQRLQQNSSNNTRKESSCNMS